MNKIAEKAVALLQEGHTLVLGYEEGGREPRPFFCRQAEEAQHLVLDERCTANLAVYLTKPELMGKGRVAVFAITSTLRAIAQLTAENQLQLENLTILTLTAEQEIKTFTTLEEIRSYLSEVPYELSDTEKALDEKLSAMTREERWKYWINEFSRCIKCYACRAACPMCYCTRCITEVNRPQWISPWPSPLPNMEWQINRVMHLVGRCIGCGACGRACPVGIPVDYLSKKMLQDLREEFGYVPGQAMQDGNALSTFKPDDKENFIH